MKRIALILALAIAAALVLAPGIAFANYKIHGGYTDDTDACAGCHRAHTSVSAVTWTDQATPANEHSALLVSNATEMYEFCYACHGNDAQGAQTNVEGGIFKGSIEGSTNAPLNGGFFGMTNDPSLGGLARTSDHTINEGWGAWGGGRPGPSGGGTSTATGMDPSMTFDWGTGDVIPMTCASCHDPHGSSNYRLLMDKVYGYAAGGYDGADNPTPFVVSVEQGYPNGQTGDGTIGWKKHEPGQVQMAAYTPNYTTPLYSVPPTSTASGTDPDVKKGMSGWCAACHTVYMETGTPHTSYESTYAAGPTEDWGYLPRHRHPMNVSMDSSDGKLTVTITPEAVPLPLAHKPATETVGLASNVATNDGGDFIECLTCHYAHGTSVTMTGFANVAVVNTEVWPDLALVPNSGSGGVPPTNDSALLRLNNRGVCEVCHNK